MADIPARILAKRMSRMMKKNTMIKKKVNRWVRVVVTEAIVTSKTKGLAKEENCVSY